MTAMTERLASRTTQYTTYGNRRSGAFASVIGRDRILLSVLLD